MFSFEPIHRDATCLSYPKDGLIAATSARPGRLLPVHSEHVPILESGRAMTIDPVAPRQDLDAEPNLGALTITRYWAGIVAHSVCAAVRKRPGLPLCRA